MKKSFFTITFPFFRFTLLSSEKNISPVYMKKLINNLSFHNIDSTSNAIIKKYDQDSKQILVDSLLNSHSQIRILTTAIASILNCVTDNSLIKNILEDIKGHEDFAEIMSYLFYFEIIDLNNIDKYFEEIFFVEPPSSSEKNIKPKFNELSKEKIIKITNSLKIFRVCGKILSSKHPSFLKTLLDKFLAFLKNIDEKPMRIEFLMESLEDLKQKKFLKNIHENDLENSKKCIDKILIKNKKSKMCTKTHKQDNGDDILMDLDALALKYKFNNEIKKSVFFSILSADDYQDCEIKIRQLNLKRRETKELFEVIINLCLKEKKLNLFYCYLTEALKNKYLDELIKEKNKKIKIIPSKKISLYAAYMAWFIQNGVIKFYILEKIDFNKPKGKYLLKHIFKILILNFVEKSEFKIPTSKFNLKLFNNFLKNAYNEEETEFSSITPHLDDFCNFLKGFCR